MKAEQRFLAPEFNQNKVAPSGKEKQMEEVFVIFNDGYNLELQDRIFGRSMKFRYLEDGGDVVLASDTYGELKEEYLQRVRGLINNGEQLARKYLLCGEANRRRHSTSLKRKQMKFE